MLSDNRGPVLSVNFPMRFGKYAGTCPLDIWTGAPGHVDSNLVFEILSNEVSAGEKQMPLKDALAAINSRSTFSYPLSEDFFIGEMLKKIGAEDVSLMLGEERVKYVHKYRGDPGYIMWVINETEFCFEPNALELLAQTKYFAHKHLTIQKFILSDCHQSFDVLPSNELETAIIPVALVEKNRSKFGS